MPDETTCPRCDRPAEADARNCEGCGYDFEPGAVRIQTAGELAAVLDHGVVAGATDPGPHRGRNEDAIAIGTLAPGVVAAADQAPGDGLAGWFEDSLEVGSGEPAADGGAVAAVVCDGVSTSSEPQLAAQAAVAAGIETLLAGLAAGEAAAVATRTAGLAAAKAAAAQGLGPTDRNPPACTYVSAVATAGTVVVGWVGDSPAYWLSPAEAPVRLTIDDSAAGRLAAAGVPADDPRYGMPQAYALDRWLGADSAGGPPRITTLVPDGPGTVLVCSDGLTLDPAELTETVYAKDWEPAELVRELVRLAIEAGSRDNISVAVLPYPYAGQDGTETG